MGVPGTDSVYVCIRNSRVELDLAKLCDGEKDCPLYGDDETDVLCKSELILIIGSSSTKGV